MQKQQELLTEHFAKLGGNVRMQSFDVRHPQDGSRVQMGNLIVQWHPDKKERILLCAHYDTRPYPDRDRRDPQGVFIGANDGGSGVAVLCELAHYLSDLQIPLGVDIVLFDGEEFVFDDRRDQNYYFIGSTHFAQAYRNDPPQFVYKYGVLLDMVGDAELRLYREANSFSSRRPRTRQLTIDIWNTAKRLGVQEFVHRTKHELRDDHLPLNDIAQIPTCDIIDFDYPHGGARSYWHTTEDTVDKCSADSLAKVGWVVLEWLKTAK
jgi:Zn-dependent M28 family amino/carboxypeptidase